MEEIQTALLGAAAAILLALIKQVTTKVVKYLDQKGVTEVLSRKQYLVDIAVNAAQQMWKNEDGATKLYKARLAAVKLLEQNKIDITEEELENLMEASVKAMKEAALAAKPVVIESPQILSEGKSLLIKEELTDGE